MKRFQFTLFVAIMLFSTIAYSQKVERLTFDGYLKNQPRYYLPEKPYTVKYAVSDWFKEEMKNKEVKLELKGFEKGKGYTIFFISGDPEIKKNVLENMNMTTRATEYKAVVKAESEARVMIVNENNELVYNIKIEPHQQMSKSEGLGVKSNKNEAQEQANDIAKNKSDYLKKMYVKEIINEYQDTLDAYFSSFSKPEKFRTFKVKAKKFNYDDFNTASETFKTACSSPEINQNAVLEAIQGWEKCVQEYQPGKKTRICDLNIDELYLNLTQAYLLTEDFENVKKYWTKCLEFRGNGSAEGYVKRFLDIQLEHIAYYPKSKDNFMPKALTNLNTKQNQALFFNLFLSHYFTQKTREFRIIQEYFPLNIPFLNSMEETINYDDYKTEKILAQYGLNGSPTSVKYSLTDHDENTTKAYNFNLHYNDNKLQAVDLNNSEKYKIEYEGDLMKKVYVNPGREKELIYVMNYDNPEKIMITVQYKKDGEYKESIRPYYVKFTENGDIKAYYLDVYSAREMVYDEKGNWVGIKGTNESTGQEYVEELKFEMDANGNCVKRYLSESIIVSRKLNYIE